jgi:DNA-binding SARP family transcriptional activator
MALRKVLEAEGKSYFLVDKLTIAFQPTERIFSGRAPAGKRSLLKAARRMKLIAVLSVYQGELLPGFYEEWVFLERNRLNALFEAKMARLLEMLQSEGRWDNVLDWAMRWIALGTWPEPAYQALMLSLCQQRRHR